ncbi:glycosyltransferase family 2 protein [Geopsychrobacter electrodiphilus]|uniref:glycosyltransferase family 2 protein n=1 Tax=Geopsychrobacter electrodiphilus TaxID=225196 RepID=UPI00036180E0|nr:glycosyltransferase family 2 protein [Geopsychrobacter electrodiphilus]
MSQQKWRIAVIIPCYKVGGQVRSVLSSIGPEVNMIYLVDDACPENSGGQAQQGVTDSRLKVLRHTENLGVGGAMLTGYKQALEEGCDIVVKLDGDGQMDPKLIPALIKPIQNGQADYSKGNRFHNPDDLAQMPAVRIFGNACLSFLTKLASGYWNIFDPTNGFTAIHADVLRYLPLDKIDKRFFFESDMLFRLNTIRAVVTDLPMSALYGEEKSNLKVLKTIPEFLLKNSRNFLKRLAYNYYLRDFTVASLEILLGCAGIMFGSIFGAIKWVESATSGITVSSGTVMLSALPIILGTQMLLAFLNFDVQSVPRIPLPRSSG